MTSLSSEEVLRAVNPVLRSWVAYFRHGVSKKTFSYLGWYAWRRMSLWIRCKHPRKTWKQMRRRHFPADSIAGMESSPPTRRRRGPNACTSAERRSARLTASTRSSHTGLVSAGPPGTMWPSSARSGSAGGDGESDTRKGERRPVPAPTPQERGRLGGGELASVPARELGSSP
ncbi:group II intron maturase-specific domain-containing protein [Streptomyces sp. NPDC088719]|uniref:group II intron maturase-specific domain-containing protein n=1 Tax=Streptomyces sp. NPDC088719 TaxID=3365872 RepID=UPI00382C5192